MDKINLDRWVVKKWKTYTKWNFDEMKTDVRLDDLKFKYKNKKENERTEKETNS
jgi:hypothetical protein